MTSRPSISGSESTSESASASALPLQARIGLLGYITSTSLDEDYAHVHAQKEQRQATPERPSRPGAAAIVAFALFGLLVATAGIQTARNAGTTESNRASIVAQVNDARELLDRTRVSLATLNSEVASARQRSAASSAGQAAAEFAYDQVAAMTGAVAVTGPGVRVVVNDAAHPADDTQRVLDSDLRDIVNALWQAGAEAISVDGQRLTALSAIRVAGKQITVNYADIHPPYNLLAIGDPEGLVDGFNASSTGQTFLANKAAYGLRFSIKRGDVDLPAAPSARLQLRVATTPDAVKGDEEDE